MFYPYMHLGIKWTFLVPLARTIIFFSTVSLFLAASMALKISGPQLYPCLLTGPEYIWIYPDIYPYIWTRSRIVQGGTVSGI